MRKDIEINGIDCKSYFPSYGQNVDYTKIHGPLGGTMLDGSTTEDVIAIKAVIKLSFIPQREEKTSEFLSSLYSAPYAQLRYFDPMQNEYRTIEAIYSEMQVTHLFENAFSHEMWSLHSIVFTER